MFYFDDILEDLKIVNKQRYDFYNFLLKNISQENFISLLNILSKQDKITLAELEKNYKSDYETAKEIKEISKYIKENFERYPYFIYDLGLIIAKLKTNDFCNLSCEEFDNLLLFFTENKNKIAGIKSYEFYILLYDALNKLDSQYDLITFKGNLIDAFENILETDNLFRCALYNNISSMMIGVKEGFYPEKELIEILTQNNYSVFINYLVSTSLYTLNDFKENFADEIFLSFLEKTNIEEVLIILNNVDAYEIEENLKFMIADFIENENQLDYYLIFIQKDLKNENFKNKLLNIFKEKNISNFNKVENKINNFFNILNK